MIKAQKIVLSFLFFLALFNIIVDASQTAASSISPKKQDAAAIEKNRNDSLVDLHTSDGGTKSLNKYKQWAFDGLARMGHATPQAVSVFNVYGQANACAQLDGEFKERIEIDCEYCDTFSHGVQRLFILHEAAHLARNHIQKKAKNNNLEHQRDLEREADRVGALAGNCYSCTQEFGYFHLEKAYAYLLWVVQDIKLIIDHISQGMQNTEKSNLDRIAFCCKIHPEIKPFGTHPWDYERAVRMYAIAQAQKKKKVQCSYHKDAASVCKQQGIDNCIPDKNE